MNSDLKIVVNGIIYQAQARGGISRLFSEILPRVCDNEKHLKIIMLTNGYTIQNSGSTFEGGTNPHKGWKSFDVPEADRIPLFFDALRFDLWPNDTDPPAVDEFAAWSGNNMARCAINRHMGSINSLFVDGSVRRVDLKELWTLKWHQAFNTAGPWTLAGGVQPQDWPKWIRDFKDY